ncbi:MAG TPA: hypothetical protein DD723_01290 [Candidatus Omnitrophica bacterium]|nr:MAG: hypothetical protein A2Z81_02135 [Omnitrophica WOR_2 bacterium GWA2_45_18]HBR14165.1 hypothetical protein [Candidatus Omnitrophota bacterium]
MALFFMAALMHIGAGDAEWAGMSVSNITPALRMEFNIPKDEQGVVVNWSEDPAYSAGVLGGDLLKAINNKKVKNISEFLKGAKAANLETGVLLDMLRNGQPLYITMENKLGINDKKALNLDAAITGTAGIPQGMTQAAFANRSPAETAEAGPAAGEAGAIMGGQNTPPLKLPSPREQGAVHKELIEGHWLGIELIPLTPELAKEYQVPAEINGLLVDEISLESAESGILAGDVVVAVNRIATPDLIAFTEATRRVKNRYKAKILVSRRGQLLEFTFSSTRTLGFSQNEAAQPITPNALSPHRIRHQPCTACHIFMATGGQLPTDAGDILPNPPPITRGAIPPHEYRGKCNTCHIILKK